MTSGRRGPKARVRLGFPIAVVKRWFPARYPLSRPGNKRRGLDMRKELEQRFATRWPEWFRDLYGDVTQTCLHFGFEHRDGWFDLVWRLCEQIEEVPNKGKSFKVTQVKQKFGGLCLNVAGSDDAFDAIYALVAAAEQESFHVCEVCGQPGYLIGHNRTRCDVHFHSGSSPEWDERYRKTMGERGYCAEEIGTYAY
jgi:hypothetical protein